MFLFLYYADKVVKLLHCKKCGSQNHVKAWFVKGEQRYKCKDCGCQFVPTKQHGKSESEKLMAAWLYSHGLSFRTIASFFKINVRTVFVWVKTFAQDNYVKPQSHSSGVVVELDEMWHYLGLKKQSQDMESLLS